MRVRRSKPNDFLVLTGKELLEGIKGRKYIYRSGSTYYVSTKKRDYLDRVIVSYEDIAYYYVQEDYSKIKNNEEYVCPVSS
jgi:hypothetical protein